MLRSAALLRPPWRCEYRCVAPYHKVPPRSRHILLIPAALAAIHSRAPFRAAPLPPLMLCFAIPCGPLPPIDS